MGDPTRAIEVRWYEGTGKLEIRRGMPLGPSPSRNLTCGATLTGTTYSACGHGRHGGTAQVRRQFHFHATSSDGSAISYQTPAVNGRIVVRSPT